MQANDAASKDAQAKEFYIRHCVTQSVLYASLISPPLLLAGSVLRGRGFHVNRFLRSNAGLVFLGGGLGGAGIGFTQTNSMDSEALRSKVTLLRHDGRQIVKQDYATVGAILGTLLTTTVLLRRASTLNTIFGGASLGIAGGLTTYFVKSQSAQRETKEVLGQVVPAAEEVKDKAKDVLNKTK